MGLYDRRCIITYRSTYVCVFTLPMPRPVNYIVNLTFVDHIRTLTTFVLFNVYNFMKTCNGFFESVNPQVYIIFVILHSNREKAMCPPVDFLSNRVMRFLCLRTCGCTARGFSHRCLASYEY